MHGELWVGSALADSGAVVLHRVSAAFSGAVDTVPVDAAGAFELRLPATPGAEGDVFFASTWYDEVLYFGDAMTGEFAPDSTYVIRAYPAAPAETVPRPAVAVRNLILERAGAGAGAGAGSGWTATDVFQVRNETDATVVSSEHGAAWSHPLPGGATDLRTEGGGLSEVSATLARGRVEVSEPVPPGSSVFFFRYRIPSGDFDVPMEGTTGSMELLVPAGGPETDVEGLAPAGEAELEGVSYRRFAGRGLAPGVATVRARSPADGLSGARLVAVLAAVALGAAGTVVAARWSAAGRRRGMDRRELVLEVAELDEAALAGDVNAEEHRRRRRDLLQRLDG